MSETSKYWLKSHAISNVGKVRRINEDAFLERPDIGLWAVADGMGGHQGGDVASKMIVDALKRIKPNQTLEYLVEKIEDELDAVNQNLIKQAKRFSPPRVIGSTIVLMILHQDYCFFLWAGDSRLYRLRNSKLVRMTIDHSQVENYIASGLITREQASSHPEGNVITRAIGATQKLYLEMDIQKIEVGDRYLLCSDGLTRHLSDSEFQDLLGKGEVKEVCENLINLTLERGAGDNVTAALVEVDLA